MTDKDLKQLTPPEQKVAARVLSKEGNSTREIQKMIGIDDVTAWRALDQVTPEGLKRFEADFINMRQLKKKKGIVAVDDRLLELIPKEKRIDQVVKAGEYFAGNKEQTLQQININVSRGE